MELTEAVESRRSVRAFTNKAVPRDALDDAIRLAVQAPAPHHSAPWRFLILQTPGDKERLARSMAEAWRADLRTDGISDERIEAILGRSHQLLTNSPVLVVCCADMSKSHRYADDRRARAEWSLYAHSIGAALQTFMLALVERDIASCWISAPVFCGEVIRKTFALQESLEPHALVLVGYASPEYKPRTRPRPDADRYTIDP